MFAGFAEYEREIILERTRRGRIARVKSGKYQLGSVPYGYRWRPDKSGYDPDPATAPIVVRLYTGVATGSTLETLAATLRREGVPTPTGRGAWHRSTKRC